MMLQMRQWMENYLSRKGQGMIEYAIIVLIVVLIGVTLYGNSTISSQITNLYNKVGATIDSNFTTTTSGSAAQ